MSLTRELDKKDSPIKRWFAERVVNVKSISEPWLTAVKAAPLIRPDTDLRIQISESRRTRGCRSVHF